MVQHCGHDGSANSGTPFATEVDRVCGEQKYPSHEDWTPSGPGELDELTRHETHLREVQHPIHDREDGISPKAVPPKSKPVDLGFDY
jgi:hypothetical protein